MQIFDGSTGALVGPVAAGSVLLTRAPSSTCSPGSFEGTFRVPNLSQDTSYIAHAVAEDLTEPAANRMTSLCRVPSGLLRCAPRDDPVIKSIQAACECRGRSHAQVSVTAGRQRQPAAPEGIHVHYMVLEATLPVTGAAAGSVAFPWPSARQVRASSVRDTVPTAVVLASGTLCVENDQSTTFTVPDLSSSVELKAERDYIVCVAPPLSPAESHGPATCTMLSAFEDEVPLSCSVSGCSCSNSTLCSTELTCSTSTTGTRSSDRGSSALLRYRASPSDCGGLQNLTCASFFTETSLSPNQCLKSAPETCCPAMNRPLTQALKCCPILAEGEVDIKVEESVVVKIPGMASCKDVDILSCAARTSCHHCPKSQTCALPAPFCEHEEDRQAICQSTQLKWAPNNDTCTAATGPAPQPAPSAVSYSKPQLKRNVQCGDDRCAPGICQLTICKPDSNGTCSSLPGPPQTVYAMTDSPGTVCCMSLHYTASVPSAKDIMQGVIPSEELGAGYNCSEASAARLWSAVSFTSLTDFELHMVRTAPQKISGCTF